MSWQIIVASSDAGQSSELRKGAERIAASIVASGQQAEVLEAKSVAEARGLLSGTNEDLVIAYRDSSEAFFRAGSPA